MGAVSIGKTVDRQRWFLVASVHLIIGSEFTLNEFIEDFRVFLALFFSKRVVRVEMI